MNKAAALAGPDPNTGRNSPVWSAGNAGFARKFSMLKTRFSRKRDDLVGSLKSKLHQNRLHRYPVYDPVESRQALASDKLKRSIDAQATRLLTIREGWLSLVGESKDGRQPNKIKETCSASCSSSTTLTSTSASTGS